MISRTDIEDMTDAQDEAPETVCVKLTDGYEHNWWGVVTDEFDEDGVSYVRADLARPSQAGDGRVARLVAAAAHLLRNYLQDELYEPDLCVSDEHWAAIRDLDAALAAMDTPKGGGDE